MPTIKNVSRHVDDLHDGRPIAAYAVATVTADDLKLDHYQQRIADEVFVVADEKLDADQVEKAAETAAKRADQDAAKAAKTEAANEATANTNEGA